MADAQLIYGASEQNADLFYWGKFWAPDPFWAFKVEQKTIAIVSTLEFGRCLQESTFDEVLLYENLCEKAKKEFARKYQKNPLQAIFKYLCKTYDIQNFFVAKDFPLFAYQEIRKIIPIEVCKDSFCPNRIAKTPTEVQAIREANQVIENCFSLVVEILEKCRIGTNGYLQYKGDILTSEKLRYLIECECLKNGAIAQRTIVAGGKQAADPHCMGFGPLKANELLVVDIFPRVQKTGYYGDMTRTFLKGKPSDQQKLLIESVLTAHHDALAKLHPECNGSTLFQDTQRFFEKAGFQFKQNAKSAEGFIHSLGHGVGLDLHEAPWLGKRDFILKEGMTFTIEPGLYYASIGGARIEDVAVITKDGYEILSNFHYNWQIDTKSKRPRKKDVVGCMQTA